MGNYKEKLRRDFDLKTSSLRINENFVFSFLTKRMVFLENKREIEEQSLSVFVRMTASGVEILKKEDYTEDCQGRCLIGKDDIYKKIASLPNSVEDLSVSYSNILSSMESRIAV